MSVQLICGWYCISIISITVWLPLILTQTLRSYENKSSFNNQLSLSLFTSSILIDISLSLKLSVKTRSTTYGLHCRESSVIGEQSLSLSPTPVPLNPSEYQSYRHVCKLFLQRKLFRLKNCFRFWRRDHRICLWFDVIFCVNTSLLFINDYFTSLHISLAKSPKPTPPPKKSTHYTFGSLDTSG